MMDLWWRMTGYRGVQITAADLPRILRRLSDAGIAMENMHFSDAVTVRFLVNSPDVSKVRNILEHTGDRMELTGRYGLWQRLISWKKQKILVFSIVFLLVMSVFLPTRVLFVSIDGNMTVPTRQILEAAAECGVAFGSSRRSLRSEQVKNRLLVLLPELSWVGINTRGCAAVITVREREPSPQTRESVPGNLIASADGIITKMDVTQGNALCETGTAVRTGEILVSGYTDLGLCTRVVAPRGEIYARTKHEATVVLPEMARYRTQSGGETKKYSLLLGKNRINLSRDSGILYPGCGKMTEVNYLTLPGGWQLPLALVTERYLPAQLATRQREPEEAAAQLVEAARQYVLDDLLAGRIESQDTEVLQQEGRIGLWCEFTCTEMIARWTDGAYLEGDAKDD